MDASKIVAHLGKTSDSADIKQLFADLGVKKKLRPAPDGDDVSIELPKQGLMLIFDAAEKKSSLLKLTEAQFYSDAEEGFTTFAGALPEGLTFGASRPDVLQKLGKPFDSKPKYRVDGWRRGSHLLSVNYSKADGTVSMVQLGFPEPDDDDDDDE